MDDESHIGFVDTHAKGIRCHHHPHLIPLPVSLSLVFYDAVEACMIEGGGDTRLIQQVGKLLGAFPAAGIDDGCAFHAVQDMQQLLALVVGFSHHIGLAELASFSWISCTTAGVAVAVRASTGA